MVIGFIGTTELLLIGGLALLLFGGKKLPEMMHGLGKGVKEFKEGMKEVTNVEDGSTDSKEVKIEEDKDEIADEQKE